MTTARDAKANAYRDRYTGTQRLASDLFFQGHVSATEPVITLGQPRVLSDRPPITPLNKYLNPKNNDAGARTELSTLKAWLNPEYGIGETSPLREETVYFPSVAVLKSWLNHHGMPFYLSMKDQGWAMATDRLLDGNRHVLRPDNWSLLNAHKLLEEGWPEARKRLADIQFEMSQMYRHELQSNQWLIDVSGAEVDVPTYLAGDPEHMFDFRFGQAQRRAINITVDTQTSCGACHSRLCFYDPPSPETLFYRGLALLMLVNQLQRGGWAVTLRTVSHTVYPNVYDEGDSGYQIHKRMGGRPEQRLGKRSVFMRTLVTNVINPGEPIDLDAALMALCHESWSRHFDYLVHEYLNLHQEDETFSFHSPQHLSRYGRTDDKREYSQKAYDEAVGQVDYNKVFLYPLVSELKTDADVYIPSPIFNRYLLKHGGMESNTLARLADPVVRDRIAELWGPDLVLGPSPWGSVADASVWVFTMLKQVGAEFQ